MHASADTGSRPVTGADIRGLWRRAYIKAPAETPTFEDHDTHVYWFQADRLYADLRIPARFSAGQAAACLAELTEDELLALAGAEGFAGRATVVDGVCSWHRVINLQGPEAGRDIGCLERTSGGLFEYGVEADFVELWLDQKGEGHAADGRVFTCEGGFLGFLITSPKRFLFACDRPARKNLKVPWSETVAQALAGGDRDLVSDLFQPEYSFGRIDRGTAVIELSSHPNRVGSVLCDDLQASADALVTHHVRFAGGALRRDWSVSDPGIWP